MSKRFGRNQKRKLQRSMQNAIDNAIQCQQQLAQHRKAMNWVQQLYDALPQHSVLKPVQEVEFNVPPGLSEFDVPIGRAQRYIGEYCAAEPFLPMELCKLRALILFVEAHKDEFQQAVHFKVRLGSSRQAAYAITKQALAYLPAGVLAEQITPALVRCIESQS